MKLKAGHYLLFALMIIFNGCDMFEGVFHANSVITVQNDSVREISKVEVLLGKEVKKVDTNIMEPCGTQVYTVTSKNIYTVAIQFSDGTSCTRWADMTDKEDMTVLIEDNLSAEKGIALTINL